MSFRDLENIQKSVMDMLKTIPVEHFQRCYQKWEQHLQGKYFDEDNNDV